MSERLFRLLLVDEDPVFRLGLRTWLEQWPDWRVVAEADSVTTAQRELARLEPKNSARSDPLLDAEDLETDGRTIFNLVILDLALGGSRAETGAEQSVGLALCQQINTQYPDLPLFLLTAIRDPTLLAAAAQSGARGYCPKGTSFSDLVTAFQVVAAGERFGFAAGEALEGQEIPLMPAASVAAAGAVSVSSTEPVAGKKKKVRVPRKAVFLAHARQRLQLSGVQQIDAVLGELQQQLQTPGLSVWDRVFLQGRQRELRTARWMVNRLLGSSRGLELEQNAADPTLDRGERARSQTPAANPETDRLVQPVAATSAETTSIAAQPTTTDLTAIRAVLFDTTLTQIQAGLKNLSKTPLEIDILQEEKKRELLYIILRKFEDGLDELRYSQVQQTQLTQQRDGFLRDLWQAAISDFLGKYYTLPEASLPGRDRELATQMLSVVPALLEDADRVQQAILNKIPQVEDLLAHLLFQTPIVVDNVLCVSGSPAAMARAEALLQNLSIQMANAVMQPLLNRFANVDTLKQNFYHRRLLSTRDIERFRNELSWRYRLEKYLGEPTAIFESQFRLWILNGRGIKQIIIYGARDRELAEISGVQQVVTLVLETRDAVAPRLRTAASFIGSGLVYLLTQVIGRGIGLIGRGILQSIGNSFQDSKFGKNSRNK